MAEQTRPASKEKAPDPSDSYERSHPDHEAGMGRLDNNARATPADSADHIPRTVVHAQDTTRQINAQDEPRPDSPTNPNANDSITVDEPLGWDAPPERNARTATKADASKLGEPLPGE